MLTKVFLLKQLYIRRLIGEQYCENIDLDEKKDIVLKSSNIDVMIKDCNLCDLSKYSKDKFPGINGLKYGIVFITLKPILPFSASETMIKNISNNIFNINSYSLFSIIKCSVNINIDDKCMYVCREYLKSQINIIDPKLIILFGEDVARCVLNTDDKVENLRCRILKSKNLLNKEKNFIVTYAINDLLKNSSLKPLAFDDFKMAREFLNT